jgi:hypothetical protein
MAPEQARSEKQLTTAVDVYALGAILYELLTERPPFRAASDLDTVLNVIEKEPDDPWSLNPRADCDLSLIALKCLRKDPAGRYESAASLADELDRWTAGEPLSVRPPNLIELAWRWLKRRAGAAVAVIVLGIVWGIAVALTAFGLHAVRGRADSLLISPEFGPLDPARWIDTVQRVAAVRLSMFGLAAMLTVGVGWFIHFLTQPRSTRSALGTAAAVGLIAALVGFSILGPVLVAESYRIGQPLRIHVLEDPGFGRGRGDEALSLKEAEYLSRFLPPELKPPDAPGREAALAELRRQAEITDRVSVAVRVCWRVLYCLAAFFLAFAVWGAWAVNYLARSGRGPIAQIGCYLELYLPTAAVLFWTLGIFGLWLALFKEDVVPVEMTWLGYVMLCYCLIFVSLVHVGVVARWPPLLRIGLSLAGLYLACIGLEGEVGALLTF